MVALVSAAVSAQLPQTPRAPQAPVTFAADVAPILHKHCITCHRDGEMAPMPLVTFDDSRPWAKAIRNQVAQRKMPPWFADPAIEHFSNDLRLTDDDIATITKWVDAGAPRGDGAEPLPPPFDSGWKIGKPDLVLTIDQPFEVPATGIVDYQYLKLPTNLKEDRWIKAIEIHPTDRRTVHHLRVFAQPPGADPPRHTSPERPLCPEDACGDLEPPLVGWGPNIGSIAVGTQPIVFPEGTAKLLKAGSVVSLHMHYVTIGTPVTDRSQIAFVFAKTPPAVELKTLSLAQEHFVIPPGAPAHVVVGTAYFQVNGRLWSLGPHSHLRGKAWRFDMIDADGTRRTVLSLPKYDFSWQMYYDFATPIPFKPGARLEATAIFDNSPGNKDNPNPNVAVKWGEQATDEMMFAAITYSVDETPTRRR
jgi:mono/diheme cytochrome c family protein